MDIRIVLFLYGLAFFGLGVGLWQRTATVSRLPLAVVFRWLALFGVTHGVYEWLVLADYTGLLAAGWAAMRPILGAISYVALLCFALGMYTLATKEENTTYRRRAPWLPNCTPVPLGLLAVWVVLYLSQVGAPGSTIWGSVVARYLIGVPAGLLAGFMTLRFVHRSGPEPASTRPWLRGAGGILLAYGLLTVVGPAAPFWPASSVNYEHFERLFGLPIFWLRTLCAVGLAYCISRVVTIFDRLERRRLETEAAAATGILREQQELLNSLLEHSPAAIAVRDTGSRFVLVNRAYEEIFGVRSEEILGKMPTDALPEDLAKLVADWDRDVLDSGKGMVTRESADVEGRRIQLLTIRFPIRNAVGGIAQVGIIATDVTDQRRLEEQLAQAQRMEVVGQLTGGVAHDFNNLLAVILGNAELLDSDLEPSSPAAGYVGDILAAAERGATLTRQLLAFSRRQLLSPEVLLASQQVDRLIEMLRRTLGETITVSTEHDADLWPCVADPGQLEHALLNLVINARDAMPDGGSVTIATANVVRREASAETGARPGRFVRISVSDTGCGMPPEVASRAFEPFYTTKETGRGTGLGLSMVFGFIKQSGGDVEIESSEETGTTIHLYLPATEESEKRSYECPEETDAIARGNGERILLVEDDPAVLSVVREQLEALRYRVLTAPDGATALALLEHGEPVDAILTDLMLPGGISGIDLIERLERLRPDLPSVLMSGFVEDRTPIDRERVEGRLLEKPFSQEELARILSRLFADQVSSSGH